MKFLLSLVENDKTLYVVVQNSHLIDDDQICRCKFLSMGDHSSDDGDVLLKIKILSFGILECLFFLF